MWKICKYFHFTLFLRSDWKDNTFSTHCTSFWNITSKTHALCLIRVSKHSKVIKGLFQQFSPIWKLWWWNTHLWNLVWLELRWVYDPFRWSKLILVGLNSNLIWLAHVTYGVWNGPKTLCNMYLKLKSFSLWYAFSNYFLILFEGWT